MRRIFLYLGIGEESNSLSVRGTGTLLLDLSVFRNVLTLIVRLFAEVQLCVVQTENSSVGFRVSSAGVSAF